MSSLIEEHGIKLIEDLFDLLLISKTHESEDWRAFALRHDLIKQTTKTVRSSIAKYEGNYHVILRNGRNERVFSAFIDSEQFTKIMEELK